MVFESSWLFERHPRFGYHAWTFRRDSDFIRVNSRLQDLPSLRLSQRFVQHHGRSLSLIEAAAEIPGHGDGDEGI